MPVDLLRSEQDRLTAETEQAERHLEVAEASFADIEDTLDKALDLLADCERAYLNAPGHLRRQWNQALFERLLIYDDRIEETRGRRAVRGAGRSPATGQRGRQGRHPQRRFFWRRFE